MRDNRKGAINNGLGNRLGDKVKKQSRVNEVKEKCGYEQVYVCTYCKDRVYAFMTKDINEMKRHVSLCEFRPGFVKLCSQCDCECNDGVYTCEMVKLGIECPYWNHIPRGGRAWTKKSCITQSL